MDKVYTLSIMYDTLYRNGEKEAKICGQKEL